MSFILDALKKSETERQQQGTAEFAAVPTSSRTTRMPRWLWMVGLLLFINLAVLVGLLTRSDSEPEFSSVPVTTRETVSTDTAEKPSFGDQVAVARQKTPRSQADEAGESVERETPAPATQVKPDIISQNPSAIQSQNIYPTIYEVRASGAITLPELHLDIHVYSDRPEDRFVFINMSKHREGSQLSEGPVVAEITPEGVVLGHLGRSFLLPRE